MRFLFREGTSLTIPSLWFPNQRYECLMAFPGVQPRSRVLYYQRYLTLHEKCIILNTRRRRICGDIKRLWSPCQTSLPEAVDAEAGSTRLKALGVSRITLAIESIQWMRNIGKGFRLYRTSSHPISIYLRVECVSEGITEEIET